jgi:hypothetical protein
MMPVTLSFMMAMAIVMLLHRPVCLRRSLRSGRSRITHAAVNDFVQFTAIEPDAAALGAIVDLDAQTFRHEQIRSGAGWTFHASKNTIAFLGAA